MNRNFRRHDMKRYGLFVIAIMLMLSGAALADDYYVRLRQSTTNNGVRLIWVKVEGWDIQPGTNDNTYIMHEIDVADVINPITTNMTIGKPDNPIKEVYISSNSLHVGSEVMSQDDVATMKEKLKYVSRGDLGAWDFVKPDFTTDGTWRDLPLTNEVPDGTESVYVRLNVQAGGAAMVAKFREKGTTGGVNERRPTTPNGQNNFPDFIIDVDANRTIQYNLSAGTWTSLKFAVLGYYTPD